MQKPKMQEEALCQVQMSSTEQLSCGGWLRARRAQGELGGGAGTSYITHTLNREGPSALSRSASSSLAHLGGCLSQPIPRAETCRKDQSQAPKRPTHRR